MRVLKSANTFSSSCYSDLISVNYIPSTKTILNDAYCFVGCFDNCEDVTLPFEVNELGVYEVVVRTVLGKKIVKLDVQTCGYLTIPSLEIPQNLDEINLMIFEPNGHQVTFNVENNLSCTDGTVLEIYGGFAIGRRQTNNLDKEFDIYFR